MFRLLSQPRDPSVPSPPDILRQSEAAATQDTTPSTPTTPNVSSPSNILERIELIGAQEAKPGASISDSESDSSNDESTSNVKQNVDPMNAHTLAQLKEVEAILEGTIPYHCH
jgi:hypothetical protein